MAKRYDYSNIEFAKRIKLRRDIMTLNRVIAGIKYSIGYAANPFIYISEKYYNQHRGEIVKGLPKGENPIDYLNSKALYQYREYLNDIVLHWEDRKLTLTEFKPTDFSLSIEECAKIARKRAKEQGGLPYDNIANTKLPKNITGAMIKKVDLTLKQANISDSEFNGEITKNRQSKNKQRKQQSHALNKEDVKDAVKEALEELRYDEERFEEQLRQVALKNNVGVDKTQEKPDVTLFNYEEVYKKEETKKQNYEKKVKQLEEEIEKTTKFLKQILVAKEDNSSPQMQLKAQDYYETSFAGKMNELMKKQQLLKILKKTEKQEQEEEFVKEKER